MGADLICRVYMREDRHALLGPIRIAQHGMALPILVNHQAHRLVRDGLDFSV